MKKNSLLTLSFLLILLGFQSCKKDNPPMHESEFKDGIFVVNEGQFTHNNASLSFIDKNLNDIKNNLYHDINGQDLGDQAQSMSFTDDKAYIVVTNSNKIVVVNKEDMKYQSTITNQLANPRYVDYTDGNRSFVSCWGDPSDSSDDYLAIVNTQNDVVTDTIHVSVGPEKLISNEDYLFVANKGGWGTNHIVTAINLATLNKDAEINVGDRPNSMVIKDGILWVLSSGEPAWTGNETAGKLSKIDINTLSVLQEFTFDTTQHPDHLSLDDDNLYFNIGNDVYQMDKDATSLPTTPFLTYDGIAIYNMETNDGKLFISDAKDYQSEGDVVIYDLDNQQKIKTFTAGLIPGDFAFND